MAGNKETPRQKMINIMYLVFIAMLALNISKQVLATIGVLEENLENSISQAENEIEKKLSAIENKKGQANIQSAYSSVVLMKEKSDKYFDYLGSIIDSLLAQDNENNKFYREIKNDAPANERTLPDVVRMRDYQIMDKGNVLDEKFFDGDENTPFGNEFILNYKNFKSDFISIVDSIKIKTLN